MSKCLICQKHQTESATLILAGEYCCIYHYHIEPGREEVFKGHLFVEPKRHITHVGELTEAEAIEFGRFVRLAGKCLTEVLGAEHIYTFNIGHVVPHLHMHLVPRYPGTPEEYRGGQKIYDWPQAEMISKSETHKLAHKLKEYLLKK